MDTQMNPGSRPRRSMVAILGAFGVAAAVTTAVVVAGPAPEAQASGLATFASCGELRDWGDEALGFDGAGTDGAMSMDATAPVAASDGSAGSFTEVAVEASTGAGRYGGGDADLTNVVVEGVDELDLVDRLDDDRVLVTTGQRLAMVDLTAGEIVTSIDVGWSARSTFDPDTGVAWVVEEEGSQVVVQRVAVEGDSLAVEGSWSTPGGLVDARRVGDRLHVVAADHFGWDGERLPFDGAAVPCDEVLHPSGPSAPTATLLATLIADGPVEPVGATEVVGSGQLVHMTTDAAYLATPQWDTSVPTTAIHRFDLASLAHTGSGSVEGMLLNDFSMSEHDGHLRVAVTHGGGMAFPIDVAVDVVDDSGFNGRSVDSAPADPMPFEPMPIEPMVEPMPMPSPVPPGGGDIPNEIVVVLNEIVVLDIDGDLDEVGRTLRFGHPGETLHGIRFVGDVAYAVTFLTTDPFYVVDLADPADPVIRGELELPGFSAYLHPISDGLVMGFGPDARGQATAKLFDVSDQTRPRLVDEVMLGSESAVVWDHHAYAGLGPDRFAVPATEYRDGTTVGSVIEISVDGGRLTEVARLSAEVAGSAQRAIPSSAGWALLGEGQIVLFDAGGVRDTLRID